MKISQAAGAALIACLLGATGTAGEPAVPPSIALFYDGLTAAPGRDPAALLRAATAPGWLSCGTNASCDPRDEVIERIAGRVRSIPDLRWEIRDVIVAGDRVVVRGQATGTPPGAFLGVPHGGRTFKVMSIDIHTLEGGKLTRSYHVEDWLGAVRQLRVE